MLTGIHLSSFGLDREKIMYENKNAILKALCCKGDVFISSVTIEAIKFGYDIVLDDTTS